MDTTIASEPPSSPRLNLFFRDERARRLSRQVMLLGEVLASDGGAFRPRPLGRRAIVHAHCHQKSILGMDAHGKALERAGVDYDVLDSGCCGMAGSFGFEASKYDISMACAERVLLPRLREADPETLVVANGFSCREQVAQATGRLPLHLAEVLAMGVTGPPSSARAPSGSPPPTAA